MSLWKVMWKPDIFKELLLLFTNKNFITVYNMIGGGPWEALFQGGLSGLRQLLAF